jgi:hypothetical protein
MEDNNSLQMKQAVVEDLQISEERKPLALIKPVNSHFRVMVWLVVATTRGWRNELRSFPVPGLKQKYVAIDAYACKFYGELTDGTVLALLNVDGLR